MLKTKILIPAFILLVGCFKEQSTNYYAYSKNSTNHTLVIITYLKGQIISSSIINLLPLMSFQVAKGTFRGLVWNGGFSSKYYDAMDSIRVTFDNVYTITHYNFNNPSPLNSKYYLNTSLRNIINFRSYTFESKSLSKNQLENNYNFEFIEQDYLDAKP